MKHKLFILSIILLVAAGTLIAATESFTFTCRTKVIRDGHTYYEYRPHTYTFTVEVISDNRGTLREGWKWNHSFIQAVPEERYSIRLHNPMPIPVAVNLSIDGLNSITAKPGKPANGKKWIIEPHSYVTIRGWQVSSKKARRFFFTSKENSYASWRSNSWGKDLSVNCGVIGSAYFWSKKEMERYFKRHPIIETTHYNFYERDSISGAAAPSAKLEKRKSGTRQQEAGTGMGEREIHPVRKVNFDYDTGMYRTNQAVILFYDFPAPPPSYPKPFEGRWAPEMP